MKDRSLKSLFIWVGLFALNGGWVSAQWDTAAHVLTTDDLRFYQVDGRIEWGTATWENDISLTLNNFHVDYQPAPFDALGSRSDLEETRVGATFNFSRRTRNRLSWDLTGALYQGFGDFQSIWLAEYYRQQFSDLTAPGFDTYESPDPYGFAAAGELQWEMEPGTRFLRLSVSQSRDKISPGYEIDFDGLTRGATWLDTTSVSLSWEQVVNARLRTILSTFVSDTTDRDIRAGFRARAFYALGESWVLRGDFGGAVEDPDFESIFGGLSLDYLFREGWALMLNGRAYYDSGELQNDGLFSTAAPTLRSYSYSAGIRYEAEEWAARFTVGGVHSNYAEGNPTLDFFQFLYNDRDYLNLSLAFSRGF